MQEREEVQRMREGKGCGGRRCSGCRTGDAGEEGGAEGAGVQEYKWLNARKKKKHNREGRGVRT